MTRLLILCEGPTEVDFVKTCLSPHLLGYGVYVSIQLIQPTGGNVSVDRLVHHLFELYRNYDRVTTFVDYYGFQRTEGRTKIELETAVLTNLGNRIGAGFDPKRVLPYIQMYEFEALLFSDVSKFQLVLDNWNEKVDNALTNVRNAFETPENINNSRETSPANRIDSAFGKGSFSKVLHGPMIAEAIGLATIRQNCAGFDAWVGQLEEWGRP
ncbi:MAG: hypothetical protein RLZZ612_1066 [Pseudomonadota bacterium]|jgi:hypothetical protein